MQTVGLHHRAAGGITAVQSTRRQPQRHQQHPDGEQREPKGDSCRERETQAATRLWTISEPVAW